MKRTTMYRLFIGFLLLAIMIPTASLAQSGDQKEAPSFTEASVHDPSVIKVEDTFYVFGSHLAAAKTEDLRNWTQIATHVHEGNPLIPNVFEELAEAFEWANSNTLWAADVIQLEDGRFYMYYNACQGDAPRSALGVAVADDIEGPYENLGVFLKSGMWGEESPDGTIYDANVHPNAIDPHVFFDEEGKLWMVYGSYSGGIFILEMDPDTGFPLPGQGYGTHLMGGNHSRIEAPYIHYDKETEYYYLYVTFGGLDSTGGYNMRVARSKQPDGPYVDGEGHLMSEVRGAPGTLFDDASIEPYGVKQMGNFLFKRELGERGTGSGTGYVSPGHNSVYYDDEVDKIFLFFHTRFPERGEAHEIRVHQMFMNRKGWPVIAPYRYTGESLEKVKAKEVIGDYQWINHGKEISAEIKESVTVRLEKNHKVLGDVTGKWKKVGDYHVELQIDGETYYGVFLRQWDPVAEREVMTFTALSEEGIAIWGSQLEEKTDNEIVDAVYDDLTLEGTIISDVELPTRGMRQTTIAWSSSHEEVLSSSGKVNRPEIGEDDVVVSLTATISKGSAERIKTFELVVPGQTEGGLVAHYPLNGTLENAVDDARFGSGTVTGNRIDNPGGTIAFEQGIDGEAAVFDGTTGIRLPNGLISRNTYTVSFWLNPEQLTEFTTAFFAARSEHHWLSFVPRGHSGMNHDTMLWAGSAQWYDAGTGVKLPVGEWSHVAFSVDNGEIVIYLNGEERFRGENFPNLFTTPNAYFALGVNHWDAPFQGMIDELRIYDGVALTREEIVHLAKQK
ncbi:LamG-like jellyroll fold domain-containing protein [Halalkalibacterium halodurans]|uniref:LamG-like jellyroll fold domain-containing protein n=1 Tax=Halalkalibacterium halodurans TaxID=86665 RepID=UPI002AA964D5|nr:family 43 glycosylhydrolase [Halalkalibacterium halodurans]MDY7222437.1 family 43 glycosylhydrolase [Halalkalibacterium halodurans]MDY7241658.1 family 43 glycosylhydrolase [Halalkalibacterium halodurans]